MQLKKKVLATAVAMACSVMYAHATSITLEGDYIKIGTNAAGTLGSGGWADPGIQYDSTGTRTFNSAYDYLTPGSPFEGWTVKGLDSGSSALFSYTNNNTNVTSPSITGTNTNYSNILYNGTTFDNRAVWSGTNSNFDILNDVRFNNNQQFVDITTTLTLKVNVDTLYFGRFTDPDARAAAGDSSQTDNALGYGAIPNTNVVFSEALASRYALGLYTGQVGNVGVGISSSWSTDPVTYLNGTNNGNGDYTIGIGFVSSGLSIGDIVSFQYAYIFGPNAFAAGSTAVDSGAGGGTAGTVPGGGTLVDVGSASAPTTSTPTVVSTSTSNTVSTLDYINTSLPVITGSLAHHTPGESSGIQTIARQTTTTVTTPWITETNTTPVTTTTWSDGNVVTSTGTTVTTYTDYNNVASSVANDSFSGRIDQQQSLEKLSLGIDRDLNVNPFRKDMIVQGDKRMFITSGRINSSMSNYTADSNKFSIGGDKAINANWRIGAQYNRVGTDLTGSDSSTSENKNHVGVYSFYEFTNGAVLATNLGYARNSIRTDRTVENLFNNNYSISGKSIWVNNRLYTPEMYGFRPYVGHTLGRLDRDGYTEDGSIQSARMVDRFSKGYNYVEGGVRYDKQFANKIFVGAEAGIMSDSYRTAQGTIGYEINKDSTVAITASRQTNGDLGSNTIGLVAKIRF
jgi:hypothetical protein